ncbi:MULTISPECIES: hypothetical protein [Pseudomonas]|uniref:hypothetical protein n=1 Tax=Pseudomonas TaxID=286 RepID=UPI00123BD953|nr:MULTISPECIES: hypothetical protein [Pseudomonas]QIB50054.1 hypothetical protein G3M63_02630 [Pseudomonas sp. OIL-1]
MNKLTKVIIPLVLAFASSVAMAEDGSDYALTSVPRAQAPKMLQESPQQNQQLAQEAVES